MTRLFVDHTVGEHSALELTGDKAHYLSAVLRAEPDDVLVITAADGSAFHARVAAVGKRTVQLAIQDRCAPVPESPVRITLLQGVLKGEKMDLVVQKATELGVAQVIPTITERSLVRHTRKLERWRKIAEEAARQCGRTVIPDITEPRDLTRALQGTDASAPRIIFWEQGGEPLASILEASAGSGRITLCTGPEGGFSQAEASAAAAQGFTTATLGMRILRAETAAIAAISIVQYALGDMAGHPRQ